MSFVFREIDGLGFYEVSGWEGAAGLFTTRHLNHGAGDYNPEAAAKNRATLAGVLDLDSRALHTVKQVHGDSVYVLRGPDAPAPARGYDAIVTNLRGAAVSVFTADCVPILLYDPAARAVAAVHAGWAGTISRIAGKAVSAMLKTYGSRPADIMAAIGPSIGPCCYEVDERVMGPLRRSLPDWHGLVSASRPGHWFLNLWKANRETLIGSGVLDGNIKTMALCTACNPDKFYSYRKSGGKTGRMMAIAMLK